MKYELHNPVKKGKLYFTNLTSGELFVLRVDFDNNGKEAQVRIKSCYAGDKLSVEINSGTAVKLDPGAYVLRVTPIKNVELKIA